MTSLTVLKVEHVQNQECKAWFVMDGPRILAKVYTCRDDADMVAGLLEHEGVAHVPGGML